MGLTRRSFLGALGAESAATVLPFITARGMEPVSAGYRELVSSRPNPLGLPEIRLDSNENPYGPADTLGETWVFTLGPDGRATHYTVNGNHSFRITP